MGLIAYLAWGPLHKHLRHDIGGKLMGCMWQLEGKGCLNSTFGHAVSRGFCRPLHIAEIPCGFGTCTCGQEGKQEIFVSVMKWQSPNFIKAECSYPSTIVHSLDSGKLSLCSFNVKEFCTGGGLKMCGPCAPSSGQVLNCNRK